MTGGRCPNEAERASDLSQVRATGLTDRASERSADATFQTLLSDGEGSKGEEWMGVILLLALHTHSPDWSRRIPESEITSEASAAGR